jgi:hypothetical protein
MGALGERIPVRAAIRLARVARNGEIEATFYCGLWRVVFEVKLGLSVEVRVSFE